MVGIGGVVCKPEESVEREREREREREKPEIGFWCLKFELEEVETPIADGKKEA